MGAPPKNNYNPTGRPVGAVNKSTSQAREAIALFVNNNAERLTGWLDQIALDNPKEAFNAFMSVVEYHIPKLARQEHVGDGGGAIKSEVTLADEVLQELTTEQLTRIRDKAASLPDAIGIPEGSA